MKQREFIFGPVPSRRLGRSLGVDVVPFKTCSYDCIYCQLGRTTNRTITRKAYVPVSEVLEELLRKLDDGARPDYITLSGSGEPTLHSDIGWLTESIKKHTRIPVAVLTNGSLFWDKQVRDAVSGADLVVPSLDAGSPSLFSRINRPHPGLDFKKIIEGLITFREVYDGKVWLEVFLLDGMNTTPQELKKIRGYAEAIRPDKVQLNTVARPTAEDFAKEVPLAEMHRIKTLWGNIAEVVTPYEQTRLMEKGEAVSEKILALLQRRPCTLDDIAHGLGVHRNEALKHLASLERQDALRKTRKDGSLYYHATERTSTGP